MRGTRARCAGETSVPQADSSAGLPVDRTNAWRNWRRLRRYVAVMALRRAAADQTTIAPRPAVVNLATCQIMLDRVLGRVGDPAGHVVDRAAEGLSQEGAGNLLGGQGLEGAERFI